MIEAKGEISPYVYPATLIAAKQFTKADAEAIIKKVCSAARLERARLNERSRKRNIVAVRQICWYFISKKTTMTLLDMSQLFGDYDHTTVMYGIREIKATAATYPDIAEIFEAAKAKIESIKQK